MDSNGQAVANSTSAVQSVVNTASNAVQSGAAAAVAAVQQGVGHMTGSADKSSAIADETTPTHNLGAHEAASPLERRNSLEKALQNRPAAEDLKNRNILLNTTVAPSLQAAQLELERQQATDSLKKGLEKRPTEKELVERNILPDSNVAPALQANQRSLEKHMRADSLEAKLQARPKPDELVKEGILEANEDPLKQ